MNGRLHEDALRQKLADARKASSADQMAADADQTASDADQVSSDTDQTASDTDQTGADRDQRASDLDQATADRDRAKLGDLAPSDEKAYESSRGDLTMRGARRRRARPLTWAPGVMPPGAIEASLWVHDPYAAPVYA